MNRIQKRAALLLTLFAAVMFTSLACGGGGGTSTTSSTSPTISPSTTPSSSPTTPPPSTTPPPQYYSIDEFGGSWLVTGTSRKIDSVPSIDWYLNLNETGAFVAEPDFLSLPRIAGGSIILNNTSTGAFSGTIQFVEIDRGIPVTVNVSGTLSMDRRTLSITVDGSQTTAARQAGISGFTGFYCFDNFEQIAKTGEYLYRNSQHVTLSSDGTFTMSNFADITGTWGIFREQWLAGSITRDVGLNLFLDGTLTFALSSVNRKIDGAIAIGDLTGTFTFSGPARTFDGNVSAYEVNRTQNNFVASDIAQSWGIMIEPVGTGGEYDQITGFVIGTAGVIPAQSDIGVTGGNYTLDTRTGYYEITLNFADSTSEIIGILSPTRCYAYGMEYVDGSENPFNELRLFRETNNPGWTVAGRNGNWSVDRLPEVITEVTTPAYVANFTVTNGRLENPVAGGLPIPVDIDFEISGCMLSTGPNQYMMYVRVTETTTSTEIAVYVLGTIDTETNGTDNAAVSFAVATDVAPLSAVGQGMLQKYSSSSVREVDFAGTYTMDDGTYFTLIYDNSIPFLPFLRADIDGTDYTLVWLNKANLLFVLADISQTTPTIFNNTFYFMSPKETLYLTGVYMFSNDVMSYGMEGFK